MCAIIRCTARCCSTWLTSNISLSVADTSSGTKAITYRAELQQVLPASPGISNAQATPPESDQGLFMRLFVRRAWRFSRTSIYTLLRRLCARTSPNACAKWWTEFETRTVLPSVYPAVAWCCTLQSFLTLRHLSKVHWRSLSLDSLVVIQGKSYPFQSSNSPALNTRTRKARCSSSGAESDYKASAESWREGHY